MVWSQLFLFQRVSAAAGGADVVVVAVVAVCTLSLASFTSNEMLNFVFRFSFNHNFEQCPICVQCMLGVLGGMRFSLHIAVCVCMQHTVKFSQQRKIVDAKI